MVLPAKLLLVAKYGFLSLIVTGAGVLLGNVVVVKHQQAPSAEFLVQHPPVSVLLEDSRVLDTDHEKCFSEPSKSFCSWSAERQLQVLHAKRGGEEGAEPLSRNSRDSPQPGPHHPVYHLLRTFYSLMSIVGVRPILLEPSMLFCALSPAHKVNLLVRGFSPNRFRGSRRIVTVGLADKEAAIFDQENAIARAIEAGFEVSRVRRWQSFISSDGNGTESGFRTTHVFLMHRSLAVHCVVLFESVGHLWHDRLASGDFGLENVLFEKRSAYESFHTMPLNFQGDEGFQIHIPSSPQHFLFELQDSSFTECNSSKIPADDFQPPVHPNLTRAEMVNRAAIVIQELKSVFISHLVRFWLHGESFRGWLENCDIFSNTIELNFALQPFKIKDQNLTQLLDGNEYLSYAQLAEPESRLELDCYGLRVNIIVCGQGERECWEDDGSGEERSRTSSDLKLCSSSILGFLVHVPCLN